MKSRLGGARPRRGGLVWSFRNGTRGNALAVEIEDILTIDVVFIGVELLRDESEVARFGEAMRSDIHQTQSLIGIDSRGAALPPMRELRVPRERLNIETSQARTKILKEFPSHESDVIEFIRLAQTVIDHTDLGEALPSAFGFNTSIVYRPTSGQSAIEYLGERVFGPKRELHRGWELAAGFGTLVFLGEGYQWMMKLEPRLQQRSTEKVFLDLNLHIAEARLPEADEMEHLALTLWSRAHTLIEEIDNE